MPGWHPHTRCAAAGASARLSGPPRPAVAVCCPANIAGTTPCAAASGNATLRRRSAPPVRAHTGRRGYCRADTPVCRRAPGTACSSLRHTHAPLVANARAYCAPAVLLRRLRNQRRASGSLTHALTVGAIHPSQPGRRVPAPRPVAGSAAPGWSPTTPSPEVGDAHVAQRRRKVASSGACRVRTLSPVRGHYLVAPGRLHRAGAATSVVVLAAAHIRNAVIAFFGTRVPSL